MAIYKPPFNISKRNRNNKSVFLAGSIEMDKAENWQNNLSQYFNNRGWNVLNPRRDEWDDTWEQSFNNPQFFQQVQWELKALEQSDLIILYFDPNTKSPISLLEMGMYVNSNKLKVICPEGFWRKGNVEIVCHYYDVPFYESIDVMILDFEQNEELLKEKI